MSGPTEAQLKMARRIAANMPGTNALQKYAFLDGEWDDAPVVQAALAAIIETSERAAKLADKLNGVGSPKRSYVGDALRNGYHIPGEKS